MIEYFAIVFLVGLILFCDYLVIMAIFEEPDIYELECYEKNGVEYCDGLKNYNFH